MERIKKEIVALNGILVGSINKRFGPCGKTNCRCSKGEEYWHGPYYTWTRKVKGKTVTRSLTKEQVDYCKKAMRNMKRLNKIIERWKLITIKNVEKINN